MNPPKVGIFGLTGCAGDQLVILNAEDELLDIVRVLDVKDFLMASSGNDTETELDIAFVEGAVVTLSDDRVALVSKTSLQEPLYPEVQIIRQGEDAPPTRVNLAETLDLLIACVEGMEIAAYLQGVVQPGDIVLTLGAGNVWQVGEALLRALGEAG